MASSPDSSSDSSPDTSPQHGFDGPNVEAERMLPGVIIAHRAGIAQFIMQIYDVGCSLQMPRLRDCARGLLKLIPADVATVDMLYKACGEFVKMSPRHRPAVSPLLEDIFFATSPGQVWYTLEVRKVVPK